MMRALGLEFYKTRRRRVWWIVAALIAVQCLWSMWGVSRMDARDLEQGWMFFIYQFPLLNSLMMPIVVAVIASRLTDVEHKGQTLRLLGALMPIGRLFDAKFLCGALVLMVVAALQGAAMLLVGLLYNFPNQIPFSALGLYLLFTISVNLALLALQQTLSLQFANQMVAFTVGVLGAFFGLFSMYLPPLLQKFLTWGYYGVLMIVGMNWDPATRISDLYWTHIDWGGWALLLLQGACLYGIGRALLTRKEN